MGSGFGPGIFAENCRICLVLTHKMSSIANVASVTKQRSVTRSGIFVQISAKKNACYLLKQAGQAVVVLMRAVATSYCPDLRRGDNNPRVGAHWQL